MGLDQLVELFSDVSKAILPILGVIVLIFLIVFLKHLITVAKNANDTITTLQKTLDTTNSELESLKKPLNTLNELSSTVDSVHEASKQAIRSTMAILIDNISVVKDWVFDYLNKGQKNDKECTQEVQTDERSNA